MDNKSKRALTKWAVYILLILNFTIEDSSFIVNIFGYMIYFIISCMVADALFKRKDDDDKSTRAPKE